MSFYERNSRYLSEAFNLNSIMRKLENISVETTVAKRTYHSWFQCFTWNIGKTVKKRIVGDAKFKALIKHWCNYWIDPMSNLKAT